ncbi:hypothetical protein EH151_04375 [Elizabethkingia anophelis]|uniref:hypothetical protein n=1 Tax=Elizabethkingia anophelis TaxID=1117645 RepID=UPI00136A4768|nr:hypothetical protein [Elizabethkingia anophelis]MYZ59125.1 hypothetical protein [Elizabethkingia anophelis]
MNLKFIKMSGFTAAVLFLGITSCRSTDTDNNLANVGTAAVKINFKGDAYDEDTDPKAATRSMVAEKTTVMINPSTYVNIEAVPGNAPKIRTDRGVLNMSVLRVMAYEKSTMKYVTHKDYFIINGSAMGGEPLKLDGGTTYAIIAYSYGSDASLPEPNKTDLLYQVELDYDYTDSRYRDFMYYLNTDFTPVGGVDNTLDILLRHRLVSLTAKLSTAGAKIESVKNFTITPHSKTSKIYLVSGNFHSSGPDVGGMNDIKYNNINSANVTTHPVLINGDTGGAKGGKFAATITIDGTEKHITTGAFFSLKRGTKKNLNIDFKISDLKKCKIRTGPLTNDYREFMCHNLGADTSADPFTPDKRLHGGKFKYGATMEMKDSGYYISQEDDQNPNYMGAGRPAPESIWKRTNSEIPAVDGWINGKANPCPTGYSVPDISLWHNVYDNNTVIKEGDNWPSATGRSVIYTNGVTFIDKANPDNKLFLPAAGFRASITSGNPLLWGAGENWLVGGNADYWSITKGNRDNYRVFDLYQSTGQKLSINKTFEYHPSRGYPVRCVKD